MPASWRLALSTLAAKRGRSALMAGAVALAASLVVALTSAVGSVQATMELRLRRIVGGADARVIHQFNGPIGLDVLEQVRSWDGVEVASGVYVAGLALVRPDGAEDPETGRPRRMDARAIGVEREHEEAFGGLDLLAGRPLEEAHDVILDPITSEALGAGIGDEVEVVHEGDALRLRVCGIYDRRTLPMQQRGIVRLDRRTLDAAAGRPGELTSIQIRLRGGVDVAAFCAAHADQLPEAMVLEPAEMALSGFHRRNEVSRLAFIVSSVLAFMSAAFIIVTGMTTGLAEQQREMAMIRCVGGARRQLFGHQMIVGVVLGGIGSIVGIPLGLALGATLVWWFRDLLPGGLVVSVDGLVLSFLGAFAAGLLGALYPAWEASRIEPIRALTARGRPVGRPAIVGAFMIAALLIASQPLLMLLGDANTQFWTYVTVGLPLIYLGYFVLSVPVLVLVTKVVTPGLSLVLGLPPGMLRRAIRATPFRHGFTAGALMVGMSILVSSWSGATALSEDWISRFVLADGFAIKPMGISAGDRARVEALPEVESVRPISYLHVQILSGRMLGLEGVDSRNVTCIGVEPASFFELNPVEWVAGDPAAAIERLEAGDGIVVADRFLNAGIVSLGDRMTVGASRVQKDFEVVGAVSTGGLEIATQIFGIRNAYRDYSIGVVFLSLRTVQETFDHHMIALLEVDLVEGADDEAAETAIMSAVPGIFYRSGRWIQDLIATIGTTILVVNSTIAFAALILACIGVGNILVANIHARRHEYGVIRAVGGSRGFLLRLIIAEVIVLGLTGSIVGATLGMHFAFVDAAQWEGLGGIVIEPRLPIAPTLIGTALVIGMAILTAAPGALGVIRPRPTALLRH